VGPLAVEPRLHHEHTLAPGLHPAVGGLEEHREIGGEQPVAGLEDLPQAIELVGHFLALVERERHVEAGALGFGLERFGQAQQDG
jgi:hypothetical protein